MVIAICNPEFHGDVLWSVGPARELACRRGCKADFWLSRYNERLADLLAVQDFVRDVHVDHDFTMVPNLSHEVNGPGQSGIPYDAIYQLGFDNSPMDCSLLDYFCRRAGLPRTGHWFDLPDREPNEPFPDGPFVVLAGKGTDPGQGWMEVFRDFVRHCPLPVVEVGVPGHAVAADCGAIDRCRHGFLEMTKIIAKCKYFLGTFSAPLVIANAWPNVVRICVHDNKRWNMSHAIHSPMNHYPVTWDYKHLMEHLR